MSSITFDNVVTFDNLMDAYKIIRKNTHHKKKITRYEMFLNANLSSILDELRRKEYKHGDYHVFLIKDPKYRIIMSEELRDKVINHLISKYVLQPLILPKLISTNVATRIGKGGASAISYFKLFAREMSIYERVYVLKLDIKKYFYNIDHEILNRKLRVLIKDDRLYQIVSEIVSSTEKNYVNESIKSVLSKELDGTSDQYIIKQIKSIPMYGENKGLGIGSMSNQILALYYLNDIDHYIKKKLNIKRVIRYQDDYLLFHKDKDYLKMCKSKIEEELKRLGLELNNKCEIYNLRVGVNFIGYRFKLDEKKLKIKPTSKNKHKIKKRLSILYKYDIDKYYRSRASYNGYFMICK